MLPFQTENGSTFSLCSSCKQKFVVCRFVDNETNGSYLFANRLNGLAHPLTISRVRLGQANCPTNRWVGGVLSVVTDHIQG